MKKYYLQYFLALLLFGSNGVVASYIHLDSYQIVLLRSLLGGMLLLVIFLLSGQKRTAWKHKKDLLFVSLSGVAMAADWLLLFEAYAQIGVSLGMLINYCGPAIVVAFSFLLFGERITFQKLAALLAALAGVGLLGGQAAATGISAWGLLCAVLSVFAYAVMIICNKKAQNITGMENALLQMLFTLLTVLVFVGCKQGFTIQIASSDWFAVLWIGMINTGISCYPYFSAIGHLPVLTVAICGYLEPLSAVILAAVVLHETMLPLQILGAGLIIGGALYGEGVWWHYKNRFPK
ncbi:MAG: DMT family transporter [Clostridium sp.]|nr:DMT family transporter [Clostridium sp.]